MLFRSTATAPSTTQSTQDDNLPSVEETHVYRVPDDIPANQTNIVVQNTGVHLNNKPSNAAPGARPFNPLAAFSSYTYHITLYMITTEMYNKYVDINEAVIEQAVAEVPKSGYGTTPLFHKYESDGTSPSKSIKGYLTGDGLAPDGLPVVSGISFPANPQAGNYCLRLDYMPNRLFRFDGKRWIKIEDAVRTDLTGGADANRTLRNTFINNTGTFVDVNGNTHNSKQNLNDVLKPKADYS